MLNTVIYNWSRLPYLYLFYIPKKRFAQKYSKVAKSNPFCLEAHIGFFRLSMQEVFYVYFLGPFGKKGLITFHFSKNMFSFSKWVSEWAFIFKMSFFFEMCFHFQNVKGFVSVVFPFSKKHNCKQKSALGFRISFHL